MRARNRLTSPKMRDADRVASLGKIRVGWRGPRGTLDLSGSISRVGIASLATGLVLACTGDRSVTAPQITRAMLLQAMSSSAAEAIGSDGKLDLGAPPSTGRAEISGAKAGELAVAVARHNLPYNHKYYDAKRGRPIPYQKLVVCGEPLHASSAFERLAVDDPGAVPHPAQKSVGPWWLVKLCAPGLGPQMNIAVSAYATDLGMRADGGVNFPSIGGGNFLPEAIPIGQSDDDLPSAEAAVLLAARLTGRRVVAVPELIAPYFREDSPVGARWRIRLDGLPRLRGTNGETLETSEVYLSRIRPTNGPASRFWTADPVQPGDAEVTFFPLPRVGENFEAYLVRQKEGTNIVRVRRRNGVPFKFTAASIAQ